MRAKKAFLNMGMSLVYQICSIACGLITPRLILTSFGSTYNGVIASATQFLNMISILTLGITGATRVRLYKTLSNKDVLSTSRIMKATRQYMRRVGYAIALYSVILCIVYPFISNNDLSHWENAALILIVSISVFAQYFFGISNTTLLQADQSGYITNTLNIVKILSNTVCVAILIELGASIYVVKLGSSLVFLFAPFLLEVYVNRKYALEKKCEPDYAAIKERRAVAFHSVANIVHDNTDILLLTVFTDAKQISVYMVYYLFVGKIKLIFQSLTSGIEAALGDMWAKREIETLSKNFRYLEFLVFAFVAIVFSCVGTLILPFVKMYTSGVVDVQYTRVDIAILITIAEGMFCLRQPYLLLVYATGNYEETKNGALLEAIINLVISLVLVMLWGIPGVLVGTLAANIFRTAQFSSYVSMNILKRSAKETVMRFLWLIVCMAIIIPSGNVVLSILNNDGSWAGLLFQGIVMIGYSGVMTLLMAGLFYRLDLINVIRVCKNTLMPPK